MGKEKCNLLWYESAYFIFPRHQFDCMIMGIDINSWPGFFVTRSFLYSVSQGTNVVLQEIIWLK